MPRHRSQAEIEAEAVVDSPGKVPVPLASDPPALSTRLGLHAERENLALAWRLIPTEPNAEAAYVALTTRY